MHASLDAADARVGGRARRGVALLAAVAALAFLGALALALHALVLREGRAARRATLVRRAADAAEGALAAWEWRLATEAVVPAADPPGTERLLDAMTADAGGDTLRVTFVALEQGAGLLVADARARRGTHAARRRVAVLLVPAWRAVGEAGAAGTAGSAGGDSVRPPAPRRVLVRAPDRAWHELP